MERLVSRRLPSFQLPSTQGGTVDLSALAGHVVVFCYPYTGRPGVPDPEGWDDIPGAHGSTPQCLSYSRLYNEFQNRNVKLYGVSQLSPEWQSEFASRTLLKVPLLSDETGLFSLALSLPVFPAGNRSFLKRVTLIARDATIVAAHEPDDPANDAADTLALFGGA
jgi:peroxiredoxin